RCAAEAAAGRPESASAVRARDDRGSRTGVDRGAVRLAEAAWTALPTAGLGAKAAGRLVGQVPQVEAVTLPLEPGRVRLRRLGRNAVLDPQPLNSEIAVPRCTGPATRSGPDARGSIRLATITPSGRRRPLTATRAPGRQAPVRPAVETLCPSTIIRPGETDS